MASRRAYYAAQSTRKSFTLVNFSHVFEKALDFCHHVAHNDIRREKKGMAKRTTKGARCAEALHGHGVYWMNGQRFIACYTEGDTLARATEALAAFNERYGSGRYAIRPMHFALGRYEICKVSQL